jgi:hypothetical protein
LTAYENWMRRMDNPDFDPDFDEGIYVPGTQRSRIPVPAERPSRIPAQQDSFRTPPRDTAYANGRQHAPRSYQPYNIPAHISNSMTCSPAYCQCPVHRPNRGSSRVPIYPGSFVPSSSGIWQVCSVCGVASPVPRGILQTADGRRRQRHL